MSERYVLDSPVTMSCPECSGATRCEEEGGLVRYRCHIGHVLTAEHMLQAQRVALEERLGSCLSMLNERAELCRRMAEAARSEGRPHAALEEARAEALRHAETVRAMLEEAWTLPEVELGDP